MADRPTPTPTRRELVDWLNGVGLGPSGRVSVPVERLRDTLAFLTAEKAGTDGEETAWGPTCETCSKPLEEPGIVILVPTANPLLHEKHHHCVGCFYASATLSQRDAPMARVAGEASPSGTLPGDAAVSREPEEEGFGTEPACNWPVGTGSRCARPQSHAGDHDPIRWARDWAVPTPVEGEQAASQALSQETIRELLDEGRELGERAREELGRLLVPSPPAPLAAPAPELLRLSPCAHCGGDTMVKGDSVRTPQGWKLSRAWCRSCGIGTANYETTDEAVAALNRRTPPPGSPTDAQVMESVERVRNIGDAWTKAGYKFGADLHRVCDAAARSVGSK